VPVGSIVILCPIGPGIQARAAANVATRHCLSRDSVLERRALRDCPGESSGRALRQSVELVGEEPRVNVEVGAVGLVVLDLD